MKSAIILEGKPEYNIYESFHLPLFMVKKEVFEGIRTGQKTIELRRSRVREGEKAVFQSGRNILRGITVKKEEGSLRFEGVSHGQKGKLIEENSTRH